MFDAADDSRYWRGQEEVFKQIKVVFGELVGCNGVLMGNDEGESWLARTEKRLDIIIHGSRGTPIGGTWEKWEESAKVIISEEGLETKP